MSVVFAVMAAVVNNISSATTTFVSVSSSSRISPMIVQKTETADEKSKTDTMPMWPSAVEIRSPRS